MTARERGLMRCSKRDVRRKTRRLVAVLEKMGFEGAPGARQHPEQ